MNSNKNNKDTLTNLESLIGKLEEDLRELELEVNQSDSEKKRSKPDCSQTSSPWSLHSIFTCNIELGASEDELEIARLVINFLQL